jgi:rhombotail lipoprotein
MRILAWSLTLTLSALLLGGCASMEPATKQRQVASVLSFLYPGSEQAPVASEQVAQITVPFRIGVAFVPDNTPSEFRLPESDRLKLAGLVRDGFSGYPFVREIIAVPSMYLEPGGGFGNLDRIATLLNLDVVVLVSFDQVQNAGATGWSFLYWTGIGAYLVDGDRYDILTTVETSVFDIRSRRLLVRAGGLSTIKGTASLVGFSERARQARTSGFEAAMGDMVTKLHSELQAFRERAPHDPSIHLILPPGYPPAVSQHVPAAGALSSGDGRSIRTQPAQAADPGAAPLRRARQPQDK